MYKHMKLYKHHIIPKHAGGPDTAENIELVTLEQHAARHKQLFEQYGRWQDRAAWLRLSGQMNITEVKKLAQQEGCKLGGKIAGNLRRGQKCSEQACRNMSVGRLGMKLSESHIVNVVAAVSKNWEIVSPHSMVHKIKNKAEFCRENNLTPNSMTLVAQGKQSHHKGWKCQKLH